MVTTSLGIADGLQEKSKPIIGDEEPVYVPTLKPVPFRKGSKLLKTLFSYTRKWEIAETYYISIPGHPTIFVPAGFVFDGASIPKLLRWLLSPVGILLIPAVVHDLCYHFHFLHVEDETGSRYNRSITKEEADLLFLGIANKVNGMPRINKLAYLAVKYFGHKAWNEHAEDKSYA